MTLHQHCCYNASSCEILVKILLYSFVNLQPTTKLFIDGKFIESKSSEWLDIHNPVSIIALWAKRNPHRARSYRICTVHVLIEKVNSNKPATHLTSNSTRSRRVIWGSSILTSLHIFEWKSEPIPHSRPNSTLTCPHAFMSSITLALPAVFYCCRHGVFASSRWAPIYRCRMQKQPFTHIPITPPNCT